MAAWGFTVLLLNHRGPVGKICRNETAAPCQHWAAIKATVNRITSAMASGRYTDLIFVDSHSPGNQEDPAQVWTACGTGPSAIGVEAWNLTQLYKANLQSAAESCGRLAFQVQDCAQVGPAYGNSFSGYHYKEISFMNILYNEFPKLMNRAGTRSMSFSHETSEALVSETRCYGAAIGQTLAGLLSTVGPVSAAGISTDCHAFGATCHARGAEPRPHPPPPAHSGYMASGAGSADANGRYGLESHSHSDRGAPSWSNGKHLIYRYHGRWHISDVFGKNVYYDAPSATGDALPPLSGWRANYTWHIDGKNYTGLGLAPAPTLTKFGRV